MKNRKEITKNQEKNAKHLPGLIKNHLKGGLIL